MKEKSVYLRLPTVFRNEHWDEEAARQAQILGRDYAPEYTNVRGWEYVKVHGTSCIQRFYSDPEGEGIICEYDPLGSVIYDLSIERFLEKTERLFDII